MEQAHFFYSDNKINANVPDFNPQGNDLISSGFFVLNKEKSWLFKLSSFFVYYSFLEAGFQVFPFGIPFLASQFRWKGEREILSPSLLGEIQ